MSRLRAGVAAAAIAPATVAGIALIRCGCSQAAWTIEIATAVIFSLWIVAAEDDSVRQKATFREQVPAQPVDATPTNRLIGQHFSQGSDLPELYSTKPKQDSAFRLY
jgi:hypothetical protein